MPHDRRKILLLVDFREVFKSNDVEAYIGKSELYDRLMPLLEKLLGQEKKAARG